GCAFDWLLRRRHLLERTTRGHPQFSVHSAEQTTTGRARLSSTRSVWQSQQGGVRSSGGGHLVVRRGGLLHVHTRLSTRYQRRQRPGGGRDSAKRKKRGSIRGGQKPVGRTAHYQRHVATHLRTDKPSLLVQQISRRNLCGHSCG